MSAGGQGPKAEAVLDLFNQLAPSERQRFIDSLFEREGPTEQDPYSNPKYWLTLAEAAVHLEKSRSQVSRYIKQGKLISNGRHHRDLRVRRDSVLLMLLGEIRRLHMQLEQTPNREAGLEILDVLHVLYKQAGDRISREIEEQARQKLRSRLGT